MATSEGFKDFVLEQLARCAEENLEGEYCVYIADLCESHKIRIRFTSESRK